MRQLDLVTVEEGRCVTLCFAPPLSHLETGTKVIVEDMDDQATVLTCETISCDSEIYKTVVACLGMLPRVLERVEYKMINWGDYYE